VAADFSHEGGTSASGYYLGAINPTFGPAGFAGYAFVPSNFSPEEGVHTPAAEAYLAGRFNTQLGRSGANLASYPYNDNDYWGVTAELNWTTEAGTLTIQPGYREASLDYQFTNIMRGGFVQEEDRQTTVEARWVGEIGTRFDYLIGGMYFNEDISAISIYSQFTLAPYQDYVTSTESAAVFGQLNFKPVENLTLTLGGAILRTRSSLTAIPPSTSCSAATPHHRRISVPAFPSRRWFTAARSSSSSTPRAG
jgi:iron complex outermembrane receptor protein